MSKAKDVTAGAYSTSALVTETLREIIAAIVAAVDPEQVILFGSHARGDAGAQSDIDLLIIEREPFSAQRSRRKEFGRVSRALARYAQPIDLLLYSRDELTHWRNSATHLLPRALRDGKVLYARS